MIEVQSVVKAYGLFPVLRSLSLSVTKGEFVALMGPNGSGKSTLLRLLTGLSAPNSGVIKIGGWALPKESSAVRSQIGLVSHKPLLYDNLNARENLEFFAGLYGIPVGQREARIKLMLEKVGLAKRAEDRVRGYSRGMQQRLSIARALIHDPHVLLLDEPYTGLDQDASVILDGLLRDASGQGKTIVMTIHQFDRAVSLSSRVVILSRGVIAYDAPSSALDETALSNRYTEITSMVSAKS